jgi:hypothetical protein
MTEVHFRSASEMDAAFRTIVDAHSHASLNGPPPPETSLPVAVATAVEGAVTGLELFEVAGGMHLLPEAAALATEFLVLPVAAPFAAGAAGLCEIAHANEEQERRGTEVDFHQMRGAMLYALGRIPHPDRPEVVAEHGTHERDGARDAARWERERPEAFAALRDRVLTHFHDGEVAVFEGSDASPESAERYARDPIYRMAVDETRAQRDADPAAFADRAREAHAMRDEVVGGRYAELRA